MTTDPTPGTPNRFDEQDLTAFALGELDPAGDTHQAIAAALAQDPAIAAEIDAIKASAATVRDALAHEPIATAAEGTPTTSRDREGADPGVGVDRSVGPLPDGRGSLMAKTGRPRAPLFARPALLAAGFALAAGAAVAVVSMMQTGQPPITPPLTEHTTPHGITAIHAALDTPVTASFKEAPLEDVFATVRDATHAELGVDWEALEARGLTKETTLTFDADAVPARDLLTLTLSAAWEQLPHPDPVVWSVSADEVRIEARSAAVQRSLDQAQRVLAQVNATNARMSGNQLALAGSGAWQQPGEWTQAYVAWANEKREAGEAQEALHSDVERDEAVALLESLGEITNGPPALSNASVAERNRLVPEMAPAMPRRSSLVRQDQLGRQMQQGQTRGRERYASQQADHFYAGAAGGQQAYGLGGFAFSSQGLPAQSAGHVYIEGAINRPERFAVPGESELDDIRLSLSRGGMRGEQLGLPADEVVAHDLVPDVDSAHSGENTPTPDPEQRERLQRVQDRLVALQRIEDPYTPGDSYALVHDNPFRTGMMDPLSTFSVDVDTAAYSIVRRQLLQQGYAPVPEAVRIEELVNYFDYSYAAPKVDPGLLDNGVVTQASLERLAADDDTFAPFATHVEVTDCPWTDGHQLVRIGIRGMDVAQQDRPAAHLTFLLDVSGSMSSANKLPLVKESLKMLLGQLNADDHVSIVVYAGAAGLVLEHASAADIPTIEAALDKLSAGGSTAGGAGIELAYDIAQRHYVDGGVNRVILCTDGDFNVGISDRDALVDLIKEKANPEAGEDGETRGVYLSVMGFGFGNLNDNMMEPLTNAGNGNYAYIDTADEAHKVMVEQVGGTLVTIAKDVKIQVEFNPSQVLAYRLIGYENRILAAEDFANDTVDAGDIGAGHTVTALYEVVPFPDDGLGDAESLRMVKEQIEALDEALAFSTSVLENTPLTMEQYDKLVGSIRMMQQQREVAAAMESRAKRRLPEAVTDGIDMRYRNGRDFVDGLDELDELLVVNLRYKPVDAPAEQGTSRLIQTPVGLASVAFNDASEDTRFAAAIAGFGMVLRHSPHRGEADMQWVLDTANSALGDDAHGYRAGFITLVERAAELVPNDEEKNHNAIAPGDGERVPLHERR
ncbi:MAG: von Willebrand factor type A domain-containing protein [Planctomycetota bacterium]